jgi:hypothetical protein
MVTTAVRDGLAIGRFGRFPERPDDFRPSRPAVILLDFYFYFLLFYIYIYFFVVKDVKINEKVK